jgi:hypothetical protein
MIESERGAENSKIPKNCTKKKLGNASDDVIYSLYFFNEIYFLWCVQSHYTDQMQPTHLELSDAFFSLAQKSENIPVSEIVAAVVVG